jgi:cysteine-rich repeat protein
VQAGSVEDECMTCEELAQGNPSSLPPLCAPPTTPAPTVEIVETTTPPPRTICGNGVYNGVEECDDGNKINGDGCNLLCEVEEGFRCWNRTDETGEGLVRGDCRPICGDGYWEPVLDGEQCDDGNSRGGDGCTDCNIDRRYFCEGLPGETSKCDKLPVCGDGVREWKKGERCDDGNIINGDGCSSVCVVEPGYICTNFTAEEDICCATLTLCGNGQLEACERCDDGNLEDGDGCSSTCAVEKSFFCQNGCSGPLCGRQEGCKDSRTLPMKQDFTMDIFRWLGVEVAGLIRSDGTVNFEILADALSRGLVAGSNSGLLLELIHGPFAINAVSMYSSSYVRGSVDTITKDMLFQSLLSRVSPINGYTFSGLTRTFCSSNGKVRLDWINGSISEQSGPLMNDETCEIYLSAGFAEQDAITDPRAVEIRVVSVALRSIHEYIVIENLLGTIVNITYDQNGAPPFVVRGLAPVMVRYNFKSLRSDGRGWYTSDMGGLRLEMTYAALKVQEKALVCVNFECKNEPACVNEKNCLAENTMYFDPAELRGNRFLHSFLDIAGASRPARNVTFDPNLAICPVSQVFTRNWTRNQG